MTQLRVSHLYQETKALPVRIVLNSTQRRFVRWPWRYSHVLYREMLCYFPNKLYIYVVTSIHGMKQLYRPYTARSIAIYSLLRMHTDIDRMEKMKNKHSHITIVRHNQKYNAIKITALFFSYHVSWSHIAKGYYN